MKDSIFKKVKEKEVSLYIVSFDGYTGIYGSEMYIYGVYSTEEEAQKAIDNCKYKDDLKFYIVKSILNKTNRVTPTEFEDRFENDVYIGGYIE